MISMVDQPRKLSGIALAAGEGKRLRPLVQRWRGDDLPKQYVRFTGDRSMLEQTFKRVERLIFPDHLFTVVDRRHLAYPEVWRQLLSRPCGNGCPSARTGEPLKRPSGNLPPPKSVVAGGSPDPRGLLERLGIDLSGGERSSRNGVSRTTRLDRRK